MRKTLLTLGLSVLLAGCGGGPDSGFETDTSSNPSTDTVAAQAASAQSSLSSADEVLARAGNPAPGNPAPNNPPRTSPFEARSYDGKNNNKAHSDWGSTGSDFTADIIRAYANGVDEPSGSDRPGARTISNAVVAQTSSIEDPGGRSGFLWAWGQFLDHDLDLTLSDGQNTFPVPIPTGDPYFDPNSTGTATIPFSRSLFRADSNPRAQFNSITSYIDASQVYGSDETTASSLRTFSDGLMITSDGNLPPISGGFFVCGDIRANENVVLTSMQTIFLREHNRKAREIRKANPNLDDEAIYQRSRKYVGALIQAITYREFLPVLLGRDAIPAYSGYRADVDPGVGVLFATAAYRLGHSQVGSTVARLDASGNEIASGNLTIAEAFFNPSLITDEGGIEPILRGLAVTPSQATDPYVIDDLRNFLFGPPGAGGMDLPSLNIQRGRDHGLPGYNVVRTTFGRRAATGFADISKDAARQQKLAAVYSSPDLVDPWIGLLAEDAVPGAAVGPTLQNVLREQFRKTRDGDRFFYLNDPDLKADIPEIEASTLSKVVARNTGISGLQPNLFLLKDATPRPPLPPRDRPRRPVPVPHV